MKRKILIATISILLTSGLASCAQTQNQINLTPEESRNLRIASSLGAINHLNKKDSKALETNSSLESELEKVLYSVEVLLVNDFNIQTTNKAEGDFDKFGVTYSNHEEISFISTKDEELSLDIYFNQVDDNEINDDIKYEENIDGIVVSKYNAELNSELKDLKIVNFKSNSFIKNYDKGEMLERNLTLYHEEFPQNAFEVNEYKSKNIHQIFYNFTIDNKENVSYSIDLFAQDETSIMFTLLGYRLKFIRIVNENQVSYKVGVVDGSEVIQILKYKKVVTKDGNVNYILSIDD